MVPVTPAVGLAVAVGALLGAGLCLIAAAVPRVGRAALATRIAPYLIDVSEEARRLVRRRDPRAGSLAGPLLAAGHGLLDRVLGGHDTVAWRLRAAGSSIGVEEHRSRQLLALAAGALAGGALGAVLAPAALSPAAVATGLPLLGAATGVIAMDALLGRRARARLARMTAELPTVLEFVLLALSAGEGISDALRRVSRVGSGEVSRELAGAMADVDAGVPLAAALGTLSRDLRLPPLTRALDHLVAGLDRGAPLAEVLRAQAEDCREEARRRLLESAGRREVLMLVPLVFLILPVTVAIAVFPGLVVLQTGF
ncbi:MAG: pilus assembly protein [Naasia sp.]|nr:pilus assembly protein [Naasia sp.]